MVRDHIIIGINNQDIQRNALKEQWDLKDLVTNGRLIQAATTGTDKLNMETSHVNKIGKKGGRFSPTSRKLQNLLQQKMQRR